MHADVVIHVAENRPQELRLRVLRFAQQLQTLCRRTLQNATDQIVGFRAAVDILTRLRVEHLDGLAFLLVEAATGLLTQRALLHQFSQHRRRFVDQEERIVLQRVLHRLDDVRHRIETDHVRRAEGCRLRTAQT
jgi:hypothetical protein